ncbi:FtsX-like permease family protein [Pectobacterium odoriferum]|uniref:ABC transporter substrate-binding protein n=1 Tax=Pectobacterium odoriferum TaxID=78398 RepID=A0ABR4VQ18_9GAMM|nr:FtsX-like permease family protein [Pectobacterium odoriferum]KGA41479.1 ABC transporter substrate-binding protein [Pectobacterium odoriferum]MBA0187403.1 FtsX-like permease family protein [Pectobacterium odoriferum]MCA6960726.1 FtsX-like permease family protein [Pectobacterium odoriferum]MCH5008840.1 FtsX-like permease family protein [Pectobacterium odoriferum]POE03654.1 ABC transporter substrate-binding protein [Pectobacterium odoriferum]
MIPWRLIWVDWRRLWPGVLVVVLLIATATALSISVSLQERALRMGSAKAADRFDLVIGAPGSETQLVLSSVFLQPSALTLIPAQVLTDLEKNPLVAWAAPVAFGDFYQGMPIVGTTPPLVTDNGKRQLTAGRVFNDGFEAVVGAQTGLTVGSTFSPIHGQVGTEGAHAHDDVTYTVVGVLPADGSAWDKAILVPVNAVWRVHGIHPPHGADDDHDHNEHADHDHGAHEHEGEHDHESEHGDHAHDETAHADEHHNDVHPAEGVESDDHHAVVAQPVTAPHDDEHGEAEAHGHAHQAGLPAIVVKPKTIAGAYQLRSLYRSNTTLAVFPGEVLVKLYSMLGDIRELLTYISLGTQGLVGVAVAMVAVIHLRQRQKQIGALRAFGAPRYGIFTLIWSGLMSLVSVGVLLGVGLGYLAARAIAVVMSEKSGFVLPVTLEWEDIHFVLLLLLVAAVVLTIPAMLSYRQSPATALRGE